MQKPELLAPAGSFEKAKIAFLYGADAVYAGTSSLSLRTRAQMQDNDLANTIKYAHSIGKKVYAAINIYAWDETYDEIKKQAKMLNELKVDGIIVADGGIVEIIKEYAPDVEIHISTQANTVSGHSANFWYKNGAKRVILGRELNKEQIKQIMKNKPKDLEIEIFIHGAICFGYSGRCFLSDFLSGRSANLGECSQSCRWLYNVYVEETNNLGNLMPVEHDEKGTYIFSSKDLCLVKEIPEIIQMGVNSLKLEGRLKTEYYLASVVNAYRNAIDDYIQNPQSYDYTKYLEELEKTKTRGLTTFYFNDRNNKDFQEYEGKQYNSNYEFGGKIVGIETELKNSEQQNNIKLENTKSKVIIEIKNKLKVGDELEIIIPNKIQTCKFTIDKLWDIDTNEEIEFVNPGKAEQKVKMVLPIEVQENWIIRKKR